MQAPCSFDNFEQHFKNGQTQLVWQWLAADLETPVSAYLKLCHDQPYSFLLESVEGGATMGRYSILGLKPDLIWKYEDEQVSLWHDYGSWDKSNDEPLESLRKQLSESRIDVLSQNLPPMAEPGLFGYMGYDMVRLAENIPDNNPDDLHMPDSVFIRPTLLCIFDHVKNMMCLISPVYKNAHTTKQSAADIYKEALHEIEGAVTTLSAAIKESALNQKTKLKTPVKPKSNMTPKAYQAGVERAVNYTLEGEIFQVVLSQRFEMDFDLPAFELYRSLRRLNPSPFLFHLRFKDFALVGSSPEILVRVRDNVVTIRPIAGTRPRGQTPAEDKALAENLLSDPKERAEHLMLLDLGRNDVGRLAEFKTMEITDQFIVEYYSHVMHIVSNVQGRLRQGLDVLDALFAGFPAGTVSGAPKVRAMEIIDELETTKRGPYGGCVGYITANNMMDTCITLRTALVKDGKIYIQAGAGIVADSIPKSEHDECVNKAKAIFHAAKDAIQQCS